MNLSSLLSNTNNFATQGFQQLSSWPYNTPASWYFWAGFITFFSFGLVGLAFILVRRFLGGGGIA